MLGDRVHGLLLRADEEHRAAALGEVPRERGRLLEVLEGLLEVDDVDAAALPEDESLHLRVPATGLMAEVHSGFQKLSHADDCHGLRPLSVGLLLCAAGGNRVEPGVVGAGTATLPTRRVGGEKPLHRTSAATNPL